MSKDCLVLGLALAFEAVTHVSPILAQEEVKRPPVPFKSVVDAIKALEAPKYTGGYPSMPISSTRSKSYLFFDFYETCPEAIDFLSRTTDCVEKDLLKLAQSDTRFRVRYRAVRILAERGNAATVPFLDKWCASENVEECYLAWETYQRAIKDRKLSPPKNVTSHLALYAAEKDHKVREQIEWFLGAVKAKAAVKPLIETVKTNPGGALPAIWALGEIGDKNAVPVIIAAYGKGYNDHYHVEALGKLATPEAVDFLIEHIDRFLALETLVCTGSPKALPALEEHLENLKKQDRKDKASDVASARIAVIRLREKDPRNALVKIAEDQKEDGCLRHDALWALQDYDTTPYQRRILAIYIHDPNEDHKRFCIWLLKASDLEGVTEAMIDHALHLPKVESKSDLATRHYLRLTLNERLGTYFKEMKDLQAYLRQLGKEEAGKK